MDSGNQQYQAPAASEHTDDCRVLLFRWRLKNAGLPVINDVSKWPCSCAETGGRWRDWRLEVTDHPAWCVVPGEHPWTECTITPMVPKEST